jgi:hypothetical protein
MKIKPPLGYIYKLSPMFSFRTLLWCQEGGPPAILLADGSGIKHKRKLLPLPRIVDQCCELTLCVAERP